jgi:Calx-beta domain
MPEQGGIDLKARLPVVIALGALVVLAGGSRTAMPVSAAAPYTLHFDHDPLASAGSLAAGQALPSVVRLKSGSAGVPSTVVYLSYTTSVPDSVSVPGAQCGGATTLSSRAIACTTDASGQILMTYHAAAAAEGQGLVDILATSAPNGFRLSTDTHYVYCTVYRFSPAPVAASGSLAAGAGIAVSVSAETAGDAAMANSALYLSFVAASGGGHAAVGATPLTSSPTLFTVGGNGQLSITYTAPATLPSSGVDSIVVQDRSSSPTVVTPDAYAFSAAIPVISIGDAGAVEAHVKPGIPLRNTLTLSSPQPNPVTVQYTTQCGLGDKTCSEDFHEVHSPTTVTFPANTTHASITVRVFAYGGGFGGEDYNESYFVHLTNPNGAILGRSVGEATILPNATVPQELWVGDSALVPIAARTPVGFTVTLTAPQSTAVSVAYATSDGTAIAGVDYTATSGTVVIAPGSNSAVITVNWLANAPPAVSRMFTLTISSSGGPAIGRATGTGTVLAR